MKKYLFAISLLLAVATATTACASTVTDNGNDSSYISESESHVEESSLAIESQEESEVEDVVFSSEDEESTTEAESYESENSEPEPESQMPESQPESEPESEPESQMPESEPESQPESEPESEPESQTPESKPETESSAPTSTNFAHLLNQQDMDYHGYSTEVLDAYFDNALFTGDSVTNGLKLYIQNYEKTLFNGALFHTAASYGFNNAVSPVTAASVHPIFRGTKKTIWQVADEIDTDIVIMGFGLNDFGYCNTARIADCLDRIIDNIYAVNPDMQIVILSSGYFTRNGEVCRPEMNDYRTNERQRSHNQFVLEYCNSRGLDYIDVTHCFSDEYGYLPANITLDDYCHPQLKQYTKWRDILYSYAANKLMGTYTNPSSMK